jgi:hypothetical protein
VAGGASYAWVRPLRAWEYFFDRAQGGVDYVEGLWWLRKQIAAGAIRVRFDGVEITPHIAQLLLELRGLKSPDESNQHPLPSDFALNRHDIERQLEHTDAPPANRSRRLKCATLQATADRELVHRMNQMISAHGTEAEHRRSKGRELPWPTFPTPWAAARYLVELGQVPGDNVVDEAKVRRLVKRYKAYFGEFADDSFRRPDK